MRYAWNLTPCNSLLRLKQYDCTFSAHGYRLQRNVLLHPVCGHTLHLVFAPSDHLWFANLSPRIRLICLTAALECHADPTWSVHAESMEMTSQMLHSRHLLSYFRRLSSVQPDGTSWCSQMSRIPCRFPLSEDDLTTTPCYHASAPGVLGMWPSDPHIPLSLFCLAHSAAGWWFLHLFIFFTEKLLGIIFSPSLYFAHSSSVFVDLLNIQLHQDWQRSITG